MEKKLTVIQLKSNAEKAGETAAALMESAQNLIDGFGDTLCGYVLLAWDARGQAQVTWDCERGSVGADLLPSFCADALANEMIKSMIEGESEQ